MLIYFSVFFLAQQPFVFHFAFRICIDEEYQDISISSYFHNRNQRFSKWRNRKPNLKVDDIVVITDDNAPRNEWEMAWVEKVYPGEDELIKKTQLAASTSDLNSKGKRLPKLTFIECPVHKLVCIFSNQV